MSGWSCVSESDFSRRAINQVGLLLDCDAGRTRSIFLPLAFAIESDYLYIGITLDVLVILLDSLLPA
jgi:uncharacterized membrane protein